MCAILEDGRCVPKMEDVYQRWKMCAISVFSQFLEMAKDSADRIELGRREHLM